MSDLPWKTCREVPIKTENCPFCHKSFPLGGRCPCWEVGKHSCRFTERDSALRCLDCEICGAHLANSELKRLCEEREKRFSALCPDKVEPKLIKVYDDGVIQFYERSKPASEDLKDG